VSKEPLDARYFVWLYGLIGSTRITDPSQTYWELARRFYQTPFYWFIHNDDNRAEDGKELRFEFLSAYQIIEHDNSWIDKECSIFEVLIALSRRVAFESYGEPHEWFWLFVKNLGLDKYTDAVWNRQFELETNDVLKRFVQRKYGRDGTGGLFPLRTSTHDQRRIELWYQMSAYLLEGDYVDHGPRM
jgi:hypothetical protein